MSTLLAVERLNEEAGRLSAQGEQQAALRCLEQAIRLAPQNPSLVCNYAVVLGLAGNPGRARQILQYVADALPEDAESRIHLARLLLEEQPALARVLLLDAKAHLPGSTWLRCLWSEALMQLGEIGLAASGLESLEVDAMTSQARALLADLWCTLNRSDEALGLFSVAQPDDAASWAALGRARKETGDIPGALQAVEMAIRFSGSSPELTWNRALLNLALRDYTNGWAGLQARWECKGASMQAFGKPVASLWQGGSLVGKGVLVWEEQGYGDTLQFIRYVGVLSDLAKRVVVEARQPLRRLLGCLDGVEVFPVGQVPPVWDCHVPTWSLAALLAPEYGFQVEKLPCFKIPEELCVQWEKRLGKRDGRLRVGLAWAGGEHQEDPVKAAMNIRRSVPLPDLARVLQGLDCRWVSLQTFPLVFPESLIQIEDFSAELDDFLETAALLMSLDLVIAVDTAVAHLAGALGRPVVMLNRIGGCWRWGLEGERTDWYPSMHVVRQKTYLDWQEALAQLPALIASTASAVLWQQR